MPSRMECYVGDDPVIPFKLAERSFSVLVGFSQLALGVDSVVDQGWELSILLLPSVIATLPVQSF